MARHLNGTSRTRRQISFQPEVKELLTLLLVLGVRLRAHLLMYSPDQFAPSSTADLLLLLLRIRCCLLKCDILARLNAHLSAQTSQNLKLSRAPNLYNSTKACLFTST